MNIMRQPSFFFMNNTGAPHGDILGLMRDLSDLVFHHGVY